MNEAELKKYYNKKIAEIKKHNKLYFEDSSPKISDNKYDIEVLENTLVWSEL